jgi:LacI family transcriptional regulator, galactose operon repressor
MIVVMHRSPGRKRRNSPSLQDVAQVAGVSPASVSRVLNNVPPVSERLRRNVESAVAQLGYVPKNAAGTETNSPLLAVFSSDLLNPYFNEVAAAVSEAAISRGATTIIVDLHRGGVDARATLSAVNAARPVGYIVLGPAMESDELAKMADLVKTPMVVVNQMVRHPLIRTVNIDYVSATSNATNHLLGLGHKRIAYLGASSNSRVNQDKLRGVDAALEAAGLGLGPRSVLSGPPTVDWGYTAAKRLFELPGSLRPTGVVCECDLVALGVLHAARSLGFSLPSDLSVVGFDDIDMACHSNPPLTTIAPPKRDIGHMAVHLVFSGPQTSTGISDYSVVESPLVVRESTSSCHEKG